ncbi:ABC transporter substrate-binding protein [Roseateles koreensis]|uniref:ABC transporter substrate-binding protein n=1 Tax=Roseateles koreensis TaxID=2987526 RepID=A0ABT5KNB9_9BURK|nr:ABC transporter substrate-binding protein [Roseateles koreensis]MDC8783863.1 ABC transporter substrate-binding protein [Roseateles koreensis]
MGLGLSACNNSPYPLGAEKENTLFMAFQERSPRYLDPTASYTAPESVYAYQIYEPPYGYHYLKRPYELIPRAAQAVVRPYYLDAQGHRLADDAPDNQVAQSVYELKIRPGLKYAPHPAFARDAGGRLRYHAMTRAELGDKRSPWEFAELGSRELVAEDFVYAVKRHASPRVEAPVFGLFSEHVVGLKAYAELIRTENAKLLKGLPESAPDKPFLDFRRWPLEGAQAVDKTTLRILIKGKYPQWKYWLASTFLAPVPWEVDAFYAQPGMNERGLSWNQWPVGTGPYMMTEYSQDRRHVMSRNPNYRVDTYPCEGSPGDAEAGRLADCGKRLPFIDKIVATSVKEIVPIKELFKQGYLDLPEMDRADWGVDFMVDKTDSDDVAQRFDERGYKFPLTVDITNWYLGFNMLDPVVGQGDTPERDRRNRKLRQALSIAIDWEEGYGRIFRSRGGVAAHGPIPPGVFGSHEAQLGQAGQVLAHNPVTHKLVNGRVERRSIDEARALMAEAGYPDGRDVSTGQPLVLNYDYMRVVTPEVKAQNDWMIKQFAKLGVQLEVRATDYNQFQDKVMKGKHQVFWWGWFADYPDAENFYFLLYGPNAKSKHEGENTSNYENPAFDRLFRQLQTLEDGPEKQQVMDAMLKLVREDAPWAFGYWSYSGSAFQSWLYNGKPGVVVRDATRYLRLDTAQRSAKIAQWNHPVWWPLGVLLVGCGLIFWRTRRSFMLREQAAAPGYGAPASGEQVGSA